MKYLIGALVVLALLFLVWWIISRGKQRQLEEQRAEAASIRAEAQERAAALRGQETFAQQSAERAEVARHEAEERARQAEESAREAQRVEEEARRHQADLERGRLERDAELRRADELDPDVEIAEGDPRPLPEDLDDDVRPLEETRVHTPVPADAATDASTGSADDSADDSADQAPAASRWGSPTADAPTGAAGATGAAAAGAGAAAVGASAARRDDEPDDASARLASGVDYSDNEPAQHESADAGTHGDGADSRVEAATLSDDELFGRAAADESDDVVAGPDEPPTDEVGRHEAAPDEAASEGDTGASSEAAEMSVINDVEDYASTEPLPADEQSTGVQVQRGEEPTTDESATERPATDTDVEEPTTEDTRVEEATTEEPTTEETWEDTTDVADPQSGAHAQEDAADADADADAADADADSNRNADADAGTDDAHAASSDGGDATHWPDGTDRINPVDGDSTEGSGTPDEPDSSDDTDSSESHGASRRISEVEEIRDGGFGVGSAAPFEDRAQPADHPVQAYRDTMTYRVPGAEGYDSAEPDVWFFDEDAARRAGFSPSQG